MDEQLDELKGNATENAKGGSPGELDLLKVKLEALEKSAGEKDSRIAGLERTLSEAGKQQSELGNKLSGAITSYKTLVAGTNAHIPVELLGGDTIEAVDASLKKALSLVGKIKQGMETETASTHIPGGAPVRNGADLSGLSPREKIRYSVSRNAK